MYFFDVLERDGTMTHDVIGLKLDSAHEALDAASRTLMGVLQDEGMRHAKFKVQIVVRDDSGNEIGRRDALVSHSDEMEGVSRKSETD